MLLSVVLMKRRKSDSAHEMVTLLRNGILAKEPKVSLSGEVECDEVYIVARHKGNPEAVKKRSRWAASHDRTDIASDDCPWNDSLHGRVRRLF